MYGFFPSVKFATTKLAFLTGGYNLVESNTNLGVAYELSDQSYSTYPILLFYANISWIIVTRGPGKANDLFMNAGKVSSSVEDGGPRTLVSFSKKIRNLIFSSKKYNFFMFYPF